MILNNKEILELIKTNVISKADPFKISSSSLDVHLSNTFIAESIQDTLCVVDLKNRNAFIGTYPLFVDEYYLYPKKFVLAQTIEKFNLPLDISARFSLNSNLARRGLLHSDADWLEAGWTDSHLTLELYNMLEHHILKLEKGLPIGKIVFYRHKEVILSESYGAKGSYNHQKTVGQ